ncbi:MAG: hypothetical protein QXT61_05665 [Candidatus Caldarchaeum sp.]
MGKRLYMLNYGSGRFLGVLAGMAQRWDGKVNAIKLPGGRYRISESEVEKIWKQLRATESR